MTKPKKKPFLCPHCSEAIDKKSLSSYLGGLARGVKKTLTEEQRTAKAEGLAKVREKRWPKKAENLGAEIDEQLEDEK